MYVNTYICIHIYVYIYIYIYIYVRVCVCVLVSEPCELRVRSRRASETHDGLWFRLQWPITGPWSTFFLKGTIMK